MTDTFTEQRRAHYALTFAVLGVSALAYSLLQSLLLPALPALEHDLHITQADATWLLTVYLLSAAVATPILGRLGDAHGKKKFLCIVLAILVVGCTISALATGLSVMLIGRVFQGAGGAVFPLAFGIIRDEFPRERVATGVGLISAIFGIGAGLGLVLAGPILAHLSYHWLFWIPMVMVTVSLGASLVVIPESSVRNLGGINWAGGMFLSGWLVALLLGVSEAPTWGWGSSKVLGLFALAVVLAALWARSETRSATPLVDMKMMRIPTVWRTNGTAALFGFGMFSIMVTVPAFVETPSRFGYGFGASTTQAGLYLLPLTAGMMLVAPLTGRIASAVGSKPPLVAGGLFTAAAYVVLALTHTHSWGIFIATGLAGIGIGLAFASMTNLVVESVSPEQTGIATGMNTNVRNIGGALGSGIATSLVVSSTFANGVPELHGYLVAFIVCAITLVFASAIALTIPGRRPLVDPEDHGALSSEAEVFTGAAILRDE